MHQDYERVRDIRMSYEFFALHRQVQDLFFSLHCPIHYSSNLLTVLGQQFTLRDLTILHREGPLNKSFCYGGGLRYWMKDNIINYFFSSLYQASMHNNNHVFFLPSHTLQQINYPSDTEISLGLEEQRLTPEGDININLLCHPAFPSSFLQERGQEMRVLKSKRDHFFGSFSF